MKKKELIDENGKSFLEFRPVRLFVPVPAREPDHHRETVSGQADTVQKLYTDFVLGRLDPSQLAGSAVYDDDDAQEVDPFNHFGVTFEETTQVAERGTEAVAEIHRKKREADRKQQSEAAEKQKEELKNQLRKEIEEEIKASAEKRGLTIADK